MSKQDKAIINNAVWTVRLLLVLVFFLVGALCYVTLTDNPETVNTNNEVLKNEEAKSEREPSVPAADKHHPIAFGSTDGSVVKTDLLDQYPELRNGCLFTIVEEQYTPPRELTPLNTLTLPPEACAAVVEFLQIMVAAGEIDVNTLFKVKKLIGV